MASNLGAEEIALLDKQIEQLFDYKPIPEYDVKNLCDKVSARLFLMVLGKGDFDEGKQRTAGEVPRHGLRRYSWPVPRLNGALQNWR